jgi:hypothetical protein
LETDRTGTPRMLLPDDDELMRVRVWERPQ